MSEGKNEKTVMPTGRYLKYALGEIFLVVIGILIALQINNWNEEKKLVAKEQHALSEIISDLEVNISSLEDILFQSEINITNNISSLNLIINHLESKSDYKDSLGYHFSNIYGYPDVNIKTSGYESLSSIGMDLISDNYLRSEIGKYFTFTTPNIYLAHKEIRDDFYNYMLDYMRKEFRVIRKSNKIDKLVPINYEMLKQNREYITSLELYLSVFEYYKEMAVETLAEAKALREKIKSSL